MADKSKQDRSQQDRSEREYPHGSGDRNAWSPFGKDRMPMHRGGTQRYQVPEQDAEGDASDTSSASERKPPPSDR